MSISHPKRDAGIEKREKREAQRADLERRTVELLRDAIERLRHSANAEHAVCSGRHRPLYDVANNLDALLREWEARQ